MTKKDYVVITQILKTTDAPQATVDAFAAALAADNARFDRDRFLAACRVPVHCPIYATERGVAVPTTCPHQPEAN